MWQEGFEAAHHTAPCLKGSKPDGSEGHARRVKTVNTVTNREDRRCLATKSNVERQETNFCVGGYRGV